MQHISTDLLVVGNGIVGGSTALQLQKKFPKLNILLLDKEQHCAGHQTGHNSGVVHAGVYYKPGSLKAELCKKGAEQTKRFCLQYNLPYEQCGKLLVATSDLEMAGMESLRTRCYENGIIVQTISASELRRLEPNIIGKGALLVRATAITDYPAINRQMNSLFSDLGGKTLLGAEVLKIHETEQGVQVQTAGKSIHAAHLIVCGGLMADRLASMMDIALQFQIVPFRGEYYQLPSRLSTLVKHLIYPIPDPDLPFLGVHLTPMVDGSLIVGPNAVLGWKREGYGRFNANIKDIVQMVQYRGFWKVLGRNLHTGIQESIDSFYKPGYLKRVQKYCPQISVKDLLPYPAGIRAQAVMQDGSLVHDFLFAETDRSLHVCNAPSPAATSALPIGKYLLTKAAEKFNL